MSDNASLNGRSRSVPLERASGPTQPADGGFDTSAALLRLMVGGLLVGSDELRDRLERWQEATEVTAQTEPPWTVSDSLRYALVGALFETQMRARRRFSRMLTRLSDLADEANLFYMSLTPYLRDTPFDDLRMRLDDALFSAMVTIDRWTDRGRIEEQQGRRMARLGTASAIDELLDYMAHNPEVRKLIEQQGVDMAESAMDEVRDRTASADMWIERLAHNLLHRPVNEKGLTSPTHSEPPQASGTDRTPPAATKNTTPGTAAKRQVPPLPTSDEQPG